MRILISAAETSSDAHAAELLRAIRAEAGESVDAFGIGGPHLLKQGQRQVFDARELLSMGFAEILGRLPKIFSALRRIEAEAVRERPDVAVFVDYPDFHFRLARRLAGLGIPLVYYIPPKVWAWRKRRVFFLKRFFKKILCILPFEEEFYRGFGVAVRYVGNPLQDELPLAVSRGEARKKLGLAAQDRVLAVLVGSRPLELKRHLEVFLDGAQETARRLQSRGELNGPLHVLLPFAQTSDLPSLQKRVEAWVSRRPSQQTQAGQVGQSGHAGMIRLHVSQGDSGLVMRAADAGLIKSGTSTLEAALLGLPHVVAYRPNELTCFIVKHLIRYRGPIGLSNLVAGSKSTPHPFSELTCSSVTPKLIADELEKLLIESPQLSQSRATLQRVQQIMTRGSESPSQRAAQEVLQVVRESSRQWRQS